MEVYRLFFDDESSCYQIKKGDSTIVSQRASDQIMYSIPALPGSSGSAVVNHKGQLVAINYAGVSTTQSFNYGIRVKYLKSLMKNLASGMDDDDDF